MFFLLKNTEFFCILPSPGGSGRGLKAKNLTNRKKCGILSLKVSHAGKEGSYMASKPENTQNRKTNASPDPHKNGHRAAQSDSARRDMTFGELIRWLRKRKQYRRKYSFDCCREALSKQRTAAALFLVLTLFLSVFCVKEALLRRRDVLTEMPTAPAEPFLSGNAVLSDSALTHTVSVTVGTDAPFDTVSPPITVGALLEQLGCTVGEDDRIEPGRETVLSDGMDIRVIRVTYQPETVLASVPFDTVYTDSQTIPRGTTELISAGQDGQAEQDVRHRYENGVFAETEILETRMLQEPVTEERYLGIGGMIGKLSYSYYIDVTATAYGPTGNLTYTGVDPHEGIIAVDPTVIPLHTKCYITGPYRTLGICYAEDIGGGIKGNKIDVFMDADYDTLMQFGVRSMRVYILD